MKIIFQYLKRFTVTSAAARIRKILPLLLLLALPAPLRAAELTAEGILPHRAIYDMSFVPTASSSQVIGATGRMFFSWGDACDGWTVEQKMQMKFFYSSGDQAELTSTLATWEAKDSSRFRFTIRRQQDGVETEAFNGSALPNPEHAERFEARYTQPAETTRQLAEGVMFPSAHTLAMLKAARNNETFFNRVIFDGSDEEGESEVNVFIGAQQTSAAPPDLKSPLTDSLATQPHWPFRLAFFPLTQETEEPDYEMNLDLHANGVARSILIDYGDFKIAGRLVELEALPVCPRD